jgi:trigger factor
MQIKVEQGPSSQLEKRIKIVVPADQISQKIEARYQELSRTARIDGFRKGKVPLAIIKRQFREPVQQEVTGDIIQDSVKQAFEQHKELKPAGFPVLVEPGKINPGEPFEFTISFEEYPKVELQDLSQLKVEKLASEITAADVDETLKKIQNQQMAWKEVKRAAKLEDQVLIDFEGFMGEERFPGGSGSDSKLVLGSNSMIPGFEEGLVGAKAGDKVDLELTFPKEYWKKELSGKPVKFVVTVKEVSEPIAPELDEEFAKKMGVEGGLEAMRTEVKKSLSGELKQALTNNIKSQVFDKLLELHSFEVPKSLVDHEIEQMQQRAQEHFAREYGLKKLPKLPREGFVEQAKRRVSLGLLLSEFIKAHKLEVDKDRVRKRIEEFASSFHDSEQMIAWYYKDEERLAEVESATLEDQVVDKVLELAQVTEKTVPYQEVMKSTASEQAIPSLEEEYSHEHEHEHGPNCNHDHDHDHDH